MTDLISREAAIAWHIERRDEAKAYANGCRFTDEETACRYLEEAILHSEAINALRALPATPAPQKGEGDMRVCKCCKRETRASQVSCAWCGVWDKEAATTAQDASVTLEWVEHPDGTHESALMPNGELYIVTNAGWRKHSGPWHRAPSLKAAKAAALIAAQKGEAPSDAARWKDMADELAGYVKIYQRETGSLFGNGVLAKHAKMKGE